jgi:hypothetical protein
MRRALYVVCILAMGLLVGACAGDQVRYKALEKSVVALQDDNKAMLTKVENLELKASDTDGKLKAAEAQIADLKADREKLAAAIEEAKKPAPQPVAAAAGEGPKIKVVARGADKGAKAATAAVPKLKKLGYEDITLVKTGGKSIKKRTIYYHADFKAEAQKIAKSFPGAALTLMKWKSSFDIIVAP